MTHVHMPSHLSFSFERGTQAQKGAVPGGSLGNLLATGTSLSRGVESRRSQCSRLRGFLLFPAGALGQAWRTAFEVGHTWGQAWAPHYMHVVAAGRGVGGLGALVPSHQLSLESALTMRNVRLTCYSLMPASVGPALSIALRHSSAWLEVPLYQSVTSNCASLCPLLPPSLLQSSFPPPPLPSHIQPFLPFCSSSTRLSTSGLATELAA